MKPIYKIEINLYPNNEIDSSKPFFWCIKSCCDNDWCIENAGWAPSHKTAWNAAYRFYLKYKQENNSRYTLTNTF